MDELIIDGKVYVPSRRAAEITGYAKDYIGQLCREGRVEAKLVGRSWYVLETSLREHRFGSEGSVASPDDAPLVEEATAPEPASTDTWERPSYTAEEIPEIVPLNRPNYLENTEDNLQTEETRDPIIPTVESVWEDWYSRSQQPAPEEAESGSSPAANEPEEITEPISKPEWTPEEAQVPVRTVPGSMDIAPAPAYAAPSHETVQEPVYEPRKPVPSSRRAPVRIYKALFAAYVIIVGAVVIIGSGFLDSMPENPVTDFIAGVHRLDIR